MRIIIPAVTVFVLSACSQPAPEPTPSDAVATSSPSLVPVFPVPEAPDIADPLPSATQPGVDLSAPQLVPEAEKGEKGARNVLLEWARALERRDFARADAQWGAGSADAKSAAQFGDFASLTVGFGDGDVEGGAGSLYYEVPLTVTGKRKDGAAVTRHGTVVVRRVNDVDGATPAQLRWHLSGVALTP